MLAWIGGLNFPIRKPFDPGQTFVPDAAWDVARARGAGSSRLLQLQSNCTDCM